MGALIPYLQTALNNWDLEKKSPAVDSRETRRVLKSAPRTMHENSVSAAAAIPGGLKGSGVGQIASLSLLEEGSGQGRNNII